MSGRALEFTPQQIDEWRLWRDVEEIAADPAGSYVDAHSALCGRPVPFARAGYRVLPGGCGLMARRMLGTH